MTCWFGFVYFAIPERLGDCWAHIITHLQAFLPLITPEYTITPHCRLAATPPLAGSVNSNITAHHYNEREEYICNFLFIIVQAQGINTYKIVMVKFCLEISQNCD